MLGEKNALWGNTTMIVLKLLDTKDMYGYQIIEEISRRSQEIFKLKTGTLYPILHTLEKDGMVTSYKENAGNQRVRKYYKLTEKGKKLLFERKAEWKIYVKAIDRIMIDRGDNHETA